MKEREVSMQHIGERFLKQNRGLVLRLTLVALLGVSALEVFHPVNRGLGQSVMAARPGLDGTAIDLLERQNKAYEQIVQATTPAIVSLHVDHAHTMAKVPLITDPRIW